MITARLKFECKVCQGKKFYVMPMKEQINSSDFIRSAVKYELVCQQCKKAYVLTFNIRAV